MGKRIKAGFRLGSDNPPAPEEPEDLVAWLITKVAEINTGFDEVTTLVTQSGMPKRLIDGKLYFFSEDFVYENDLGVDVAVAAGYYGSVNSTLVKLS